MGRKAAAGIGCLCLIFTQFNLVSHSYTYLQLRVHKTHPTYTSST